MKKYETLKNKLIAIGLMLTGIAPVILEHDATFLVFVSFIAIPLFFAKENWIC